MVQTVSTGDDSQPSGPLYFEDLAVGRVFRTGAIEVVADEAIAFATRYDPQPFHLDAAAAKASVFGGLVASGWLTAGLTMRLMVKALFEAGSGVVGLGIDRLRWPQPVYPGDMLRVTITVTAMGPSSSKPAYGVVAIEATTTNQRDETVQAMTVNLLFPRRKP